VDICASDIFRTSGYFRTSEDLIQVAFTEGLLIKTLKGFVLPFVLYGEGFKHPKKWPGCLHLALPRRLESEAIVGCSHSDKIRKPPIRAVFGQCYFTNLVKHLRIEVMVSK